MFVGKFFNWPDTNREYWELWESLEPLGDDERPEWLGDGDSVRYVLNTSWAYVRASDQADYNTELWDHLEHDPYLFCDGDEGDGCVTHVYMTKPKVFV